MMRVGPEVRAVIKARIVISNCAACCFTALKEIIAIELEVLLEI